MTTFIVSDSDPKALQPFPHQKKTPNYLFGTCTDLYNLVQTI